MNINQRLHEWIGNMGFLKTTNCIDRGCDKYHGRSPSQLLLFGYHQLFILEERKWQIMK